MQRDRGGACEIRQAANCEAQIGVKTGLGEAFGWLLRFYGAWIILNSERIGNSLINTLLHGGVKMQEESFNRFSGFQP
jgi:hypothetical protein